MSAVEEALIAQLRGELGARLQELNRTRRSLGKMQEACARYARRLESVHGEREELLHLRQRCHGLAADLRRLTTDLVDHMEASRRQADALAVARAEVADLQMRYAYSEQWLEAVRRSTSWKLTRPIRVLIRRLKG